MIHTQTEREGLNLEVLAQRAIDEDGLNRADALKLLRADLAELSLAADAIRRECRGEGVELCSIINGLAAPCSEDCRFCAQSGHYATGVAHSGLASRASIVALGLQNHEQGVHRFSIVTSGRQLKGEGFAKMVEAFSALRNECDISLCASFGLLDEEAFHALRACGVSRIHNNLETSRRYFPQVCNTHTYDEKIASIRAAQRTGMEVCSGGLFGMGETMEDRIDLALELKELGIKSVPMNLLNPVAGTPLALAPRISYEEYLRTIAIFRFVMPKATLRLAGGRGLLPDKGAACFQAGANATISGDFLTTQGISTASDRAMLDSMGRQLEKLD